MTPAFTSDNPQLSIQIGRPADRLVEGCGERLQSIATTECQATSVGGYIEAALSENTRRAYRQDLDDFLRWHGGGLPCTPEVLAAYVADCAQRVSPYTISRRVVAISRAHTSQGLPAPSKTDLVRTVLRGIQKTHGAPQRQAAPLLKHDMLKLLPSTTDARSLRDRALILLGFAAALRRSELVALDVQDLNFVEHGLIVHVRRSKTDQTGEGHKIAVPHGRTAACPVKAVACWLQTASLTEGAIFRPIGKSGAIQPVRLSSQSVAMILRQRAAAAGLSITNLSAHSLRAGLATSAAQAGVAAHKIQMQTRHRSLEMLLRYIRDGNLFDDNAAGFL
ncbi:site-specific integrase [Burkholderia vietnamiensis]|uniref:site-specific integrase n=1 Tax=Burkholderia vietnamiensis TaxID=60552 RepID=UPI002655CBF7|nr:site-specific integrase [Burkholderia vietnamiensis]MDN8035515.1 site-specific integrase [Burkholderia vietnamiensis]